MLLLADSNPSAGREEFRWLSLRKIQQRLVSGCASHADTRAHLRNRPLKPVGANPIRQKETEIGRKKSEPVDRSQDTKSLPAPEASLSQSGCGVSFSGPPAYLS